MKNNKKARSRQQRRKQAGSYKYELFISYGSPEGKTIVQPLVKALQKYGKGIRYFLDAEQILWGESIPKSISEGLMASRYMLAIITEQTLPQPWAQAELRVALHEQITKGKTKILPMIAGTAEQRARIMEELPLLRELRYITWKNNACTVARQLVKRIHQ